MESFLPTYLPSELKPLRGRWGRTYTHYTYSVTYPFAVFDVAVDGAFVAGFCIYPSCFFAWFPLAVTSSVLVCEGVSSSSIVSCARQEKVFGDGCGLVWVTGDNG